MISRTQWRTISYTLTLSKRCLHPELEQKQKRKTKQMIIYLYKNGPPLVDLSDYLFASTIDRADLTVASEIVLGIN